MKIQIELELDDGDKRRLNVLSELWKETDGRITVTPSYHTCLKQAVLHCFAEFAVNGNDGKKTVQSLRDMLSLTGGKIE